LAPLWGRPLIAHVVERALEAGLGPALVATDDERIAQAAEAAGARAVLTRGDHASGTDRVAEVAAGIPGDGVVLNLQGDEPLIEVEVMRAVVWRCQQADAVMATASAPLGAEEARDPNAVKVVCDAAGRALYFSRAPIPHGAGAVGAPAAFRRHLGLYAYRRRTLLRLAALPPVALERVERLEQLRALHHGVTIHVVDAPRSWRGVDTPADLAHLEAAGARQREKR